MQGLLLNNSKRRDLILASKCLRHKCRFGQQFLQLWARTIGFSNFLVWISHHILSVFVVINGLKDSQSSPIYFWKWANSPKKKHIEGWESIQTHKGGSSNLKMSPWSAILLKSWELLWSTLWFIKSRNLLIASTELPLLLVVASMLFWNWPIFLSKRDGNPPTYLPFVLSTDFISCWY